jgi:D-cysteine desulfhydrase
MVGSGLETIAVHDTATAVGFASQLRRRDFVIGPGGMGAIGSTGYYDAAFELQHQVEAGQLPAPDWIVVATGSGSTAAGLLAGLCRTRLHSRLLAVQSAPNPAIRPMVLAQALATSRRRGQSLRWSEASARIRFDTRQIGDGYGHPVALSDEAAACAAMGSLTLDPTYTAKALNAAVALSMGNPALVVLFWNTLSTTPLDPLLDRAPCFDELPPQLRRLLRPIGRSGSR